ncbi:MAG: hypothetical protein P5702_06285 [Limnospira sp. PMC 1291.21]|uniref:hypothetical protein n=1 Tax=unclassified Limnospira TaxID=2642885 RepID=UPI0028E102C5|nr:MULTISPECIES: hypothetical protein [unclassified Limnospira]MDT9177933.1 hypothetical protein [Limnospira sp. PMC 1238.20]MDT9193304.1 hypothetical protein [Limnospira sp. PMC 1245.20]MDT9203143.1 hypothetical protein [Limnospira sp. PMC 1243.20]MDT9208770.1 hypothetical protein [Limnospira sp. PMC 1252.20]MDT9213614.1 hypothetical protein [Limnospira sp. PMC 1256.20]
MKRQYKRSFLQDLKALTSTPRALTLATIPNLIKLPKGKDSQSAIKPRETEASIALSLIKENQISGDISNQQWESE